MGVWIALGRDQQGHVGYALTDGIVSEPMRGADEGGVLAGLGHAGVPIIRIGKGAASPLPAPVLPGEGESLPNLAQTQPADLISAWVRLWVAGVLAQRDNWDGIVCAMHGDVVHWLHVSADEVVSSLSSLSPRLFAALGLPLSAPEPQAIADSLSRPERLATHLRAAEVAGDPTACLGHLLGADLAATRAYWLGQQVVVIGEGALAEGYTRALQAQGVPVESTTSEAVLPLGLQALGVALTLE